MSSSDKELICVLDFEATCDSEPGLVENEVIEFPSVLIAAGSVISEFQLYVKPMLTPVLTKFCTELTGITNEVIQTQGVEFPEAFRRHREWLLRETGSTSDYDLENKVLFVTCGDWDLKSMLPKQQKASDLTPVSYLRVWCNVKVVSGFFWKFPRGKQPQGMTDMLTRLDLTLEGKHHSGIDDCRNIAKIVLKLISQGCHFQATARLDSNDKLIRLQLQFFSCVFFNRERINILLTANK